MRFYLPITMRCHWRFQYSFPGNGRVQSKYDKRGRRTNNVGAPFACSPLYAPSHASAAECSLEPARSWRIVAKSMRSPFDRASRVYAPLHGRPGDIETVAYTGDSISRCCWFIYWMLFLPREGYHVVDRENYKRQKYWKNI